MPGAVEFLASYFVGKQLGAQQHVDADTANRLGVTQAVLGLTPFSVILVNEVAKREAQPDGAAAAGGDGTFTLPPWAFGPHDAKGAATGTTATPNAPAPSAGSPGLGTGTGGSTGVASGTTTAPGAQRGAVEREVPIGRLEDLVQAGQGAFGAMREAFVTLREEARVAESMMREMGRSAREANRAADQGASTEEQYERGVAMPPGAGPASPSRDHPMPSGD